MRNSMLKHLQKWKWEAKFSVARIFFQRMGGTHVTGGTDFDWHTDNEESSDYVVTGVFPLSHQPGNFLYARWNAPAEAKLGMPQHVGVHNYMPKQPLSGACFPSSWYHKTNAGPKEVVKVVFFVSCKNQDLVSDVIVLQLPWRRSSSDGRMKSTEVVTGKRQPEEQPDDSEVRCTVLSHTRTRLG